MSAASLAAVVSAALSPIPCRSGSRMRRADGLMSSKWSEGIEPRGFRWIITERLGVCERPGGYGAGHRRVRRLEEIIWLRRNEIDLIVSLTSIPYNLRDYDDQGLAYLHLPLPDSATPSALKRS